MPDGDAELRACSLEYPRLEPVGTLGGMSGEDHLIDVVAAQFVFDPRERIDRVAHFAGRLEPVVGSPGECLPQSEPCLIGFAIYVCRHEVRLRVEDRGDYVEGRAAYTRAVVLGWRWVPGVGLVRDHEA